jgi:AbrB family looped-hinge helix DNA binding protein
MAVKEEIIAKIVSRKFVRLRDRNQITLPNEIVEAINISSGDFVEVLLTEEGSIHIQPIRIISSLNSTEARQQEALADKEIEEKKFGKLSDIDELVRDAKRKRSRKPDKAAVAAAVGNVAYTRR